MPAPCLAPLPSAGLPVPTTLAQWCICLAVLWQPELWSWGRRSCRLVIVRLPRGRLLPSGQSFVQHVVPQQPACSAPVLWCVRLCQWVLAAEPRHMEQITMLQEQFFQGVSPEYGAMPTVSCVPQVSSYVYFMGVVPVLRYGPQKKLFPYQSDREGATSIRLIDSRLDEDMHFLEDRTFKAAMSFAGSPPPPPLRPTCIIHDQCFAPQPQLRGLHGQLLSTARSVQDRIG